MALSYFTGSRPRGRTSGEARRQDHPQVQADRQGMSFDRYFHFSSLYPLSSHICFLPFAYYRYSRLIFFSGLVPTSPNGAMSLRPNIKLGRKPVAVPVLPRSQSDQPLWLSSQRGSQVSASE